ncbi:MAG TPA: DUF455 family protein [Polyangiaceae bacterium]|nr:DUF455 family protein [Polyangiaceae bacterium]
MTNASPATTASADRPEPGSVEAWAFEYITACTLQHKLCPPAAPQRWETHPPERDIAEPGRPVELRPAHRNRAVPENLVSPGARAKLLHAFFHHELQAAELMCWAILRFAHAEAAFRKGLLGICLDEIRHMNAYRAQIERLGFQIGDFPVRDWFWRRVPRCSSKLEFVAFMGMGLEAANLEHAPFFGQRFAAVGDTEAAALQARIAHEELAHVRFAVNWFERWTDGQDFETWQRSLPAPLSPLLLRGKSFDRNARLRAGMREAFVHALERWEA